MRRVLVNTPVPLSVVFDVDGTPTNPSPDSCTVTVTRDDGTAIVTGATAQDDGAGAFSYGLTAAQNTFLDVLTATWVSANLGTLVTRCEVVGGFLWAIAEARTYSGGAMSSTTKYPTADIIAMRTTVEQALEDACGVAFVPRYARETVSGDGGYVVLLPQPRIRAIRSVKLDGTAIGDISSITGDASGIVTSPARWTRGHANYEVAFEHGMDFPPAEAKRAALELLKAWLVPSNFDHRATTMTTEDGTWALATPGMRGARFGVPSVDSFVQAYSEKALVA